MLLSLRFQRVTMNYHGFFVKTPKFIQTSDLYLYENRVELARKGSKNSDVVAGSTWRSPIDIFLYMW
jgi:hypothetical protein